MPSLHRRKRNVVASIATIVLYAVTWFGGTKAHRQQMAAEASTRYDHTVAYINAGVEVPSTMEVRRRGPLSDVDWTFPVLPGVLLADSYYVVGPLYGKGTVKIVVWYGAGSVTVCDLWGWIS